MDKVIFTFRVRGYPDIHEFILDADDYLARYANEPCYEILSVQYLITSFL